MAAIKYIGPIRLVPTNSVQQLEEFLPSLSYNRRKDGRMDRVSSAYIIYNLYFTAGQN